MCVRDEPPPCPRTLAQEDHQTRVETAPERTAAGRAVGQDFIPLSQSPQLSRLTFGGKTNEKSSALCLDLAAQQKKKQANGGAEGSPSPELLFSSGRITAARYHELLAELDGRRVGVTDGGREAGCADVIVRNGEPATVSEAGEGKVAITDGNIVGSTNTTTTIDITTSGTRRSNGFRRGVRARVEPHFEISRFSTSSGRVDGRNVATSMPNK